MYVPERAGMAGWVGWLHTSASVLVTAKTHDAGARRSGRRALKKRDRQNRHLDKGNRGELFCRSKRGGEAVGCLGLAKVNL